MEDNKMELKKTLLKNLLKILNDGEGEKIKGGKTASIEVLSIGKPKIEELPTEEEGEDTEEEGCDMPEMGDTEELDDTDILEKLKKLLGE